MKKTISILAALAAFASASSLAEEAAGPKLAGGLLMKQGGKLVFAPCRDRSYAVMEDVSPNGSLTATLNTIGLEAGKKLYVEVLGILEGVNLKASELNFARADGRCQMPGSKDENWLAGGAGWGLVAGAEQILVKQPGKVDVAVPTGKFKTEGGLATYEASQAGNKVALRFERAVCRQQPKEGGEVLAGWNATVTVNGTTLKGCAWQR
jgi:putative lipoprotein